MPKARVYELAKELGVDSKTVLNKLEAMGEFVKSASSTVEPPVARKLRNAFASNAQGNASESKKPAVPAKKPAAPAASPTPAPRATPAAPAASAAKPAAPKPARPAASKSEAPKPGHRMPRVIPASMAIVPTATLRVRRANAVRAASRLRFRDLAHSATITIPMLRRAAMATMPPMVRSRTLRAHVRVTIRSAASRACIPRLRVTFRVRIR